MRLGDEVAHHIFPRAETGGPGKPARGTGGEPLGLKGDLPRLRDPSHDAPKVGVSAILQVEGHLGRSAEDPRQASRG